MEGGESNLLLLAREATLPPPTFLAKDRHTLGHSTTRPSHASFSRTNVTSQVGLSQVIWPLANRLNLKGWFPKGWFWRMFPRNENRNEGTFGCSPGTKTGTRVRSHVPLERKPERGYIRQNHPFTKLPFYLPVS